MPLAALYLNVHEPNIHEAVTQCALNSQLSLLDHSDEDDWISQIEKLSPSIAVVELEQFDAHDYRRLSDLSSTLDIDLIVISQGEPNSHLDALMQVGAIFHYRSPVNDDFITDTIEDIAEETKRRTQQGEIITSSNLDQFGLLLGSSRVMHKLYRTIRRISKSEASVFIIGESGAGKELVANTIHLSSDRTEQPFVAINCGAISPELVDSELFGHVKGAFTGATKDHNGVFQQANGGTLFLDEITEMPIEHQVKLLRVLETGEYRPVGSQKVYHANVRIVAATNRDPSQAIEDDKLREDLYFRLAHFPLSIAPLRERDGDVIGLAKHFIAHLNSELSTQKSIVTDALSKLSRHSWQGNVRELKHTIERAFILADSIIGPEHIQFDMSDNVLNNTSDNKTLQQTIPGSVPLDDIEKAAIINTLDDNDGNKTDTASDLGISVKTLYNKLEKYDT
jgi:DNA-binding NtrC family response regulator